VVLAQLDKLNLKDTLQLAYAAYDNSMADYVAEFEKLYNRANLTNEVT